MKYFKNTELAKIYGVSEKSVRNWIQSARDGKLELQLYEKDSHSFIANTINNTHVISQLVEKGKKFKNRRGFRVVSPGQKFYETFSQKQIYDIVSSLTIHHELPLKYSYVDGGADYWDKYAQRLANEPTPNMLTSTIGLLESNFDDLDRLLARHPRVNVVDLGPGNGFPVKQLLEHLHKQGKLNRYLALDISKDMLTIAESNIRDWFGDSFPFEGYIRDIDYERFDDLLAKDYGSSQKTLPINLVLLLGGTLNNLRSPDQALQAINSSLGLNDMIIYSTKLDTPNSRRFFDFNVSPEAQELAPRHKLTLDLLNIDKTLYETLHRYDETSHARLISIRPKIALSIELKIGEAKRDIELEKGKSILLWRYWHHSAIDIINRFDRNSFDLLVAAKSHDQEYLLLISKIRVDS